MRSVWVILIIFRHLRNGVFFLKPHGHFFLQFDVSQHPGWQSLDFDLFRAVRMIFRYQGVSTVSRVDCWAERSVEPENTLVLAQQLIVLRLLIRLSLAARRYLQFFTHWVSFDLKSVFPRLFSYHYLFCFDLLSSQIAISQLIFRVFFGHVSFVRPFYPLRLIFFDNHIVRLVSLFF